jgi:hypothetical protein
MLIKTQITQLSAFNIRRKIGFISILLAAILPISACGMNRQIDSAMAPSATGGTSAQTEVTSICPSISIAWQAETTGTWPPSPAAALPIKTAEKLSDEELSGALFCQYLEKHKHSQVEIAQQLTDYQVHQISADESLQELRQENQVDYLTWVSFSVLPAQEFSSWWVAGNGEVSNDGWIRHKSLIIGIFEDNENYILKIIGTGP